MIKLSQKFSLVLIICVILILDCYSQPFFSNPGIPNPTITFLNDSVVRLDYDSIYQVHEWWDTVQNPGAVFSGPFSYDYTRIFSDLMTVLDAREYHFIPIYGDDDLRYGLLFDPASGFATIPGGGNSGSPNTIPAKNIGRENNSYDEYAGGIHTARGNNYSMPHMNDIKLLPNSSANILGPNLNYGSTMRLFHEIGHTWGVTWNTSVSNVLNWDVLNWEPWMPPITLVAGGGHWWAYYSNRWVDPRNGGLLTSAPSINRFNIFDLYAMGAVSYNDIVDSVLYVRDPNTLIEYPVTVDSLILLLNKAQNYLNGTPQEDLPNYLQGDEYLTGDGKRIPATDPNTQHFKTLIVVVTGAESIFTGSDQDLVLKLARDVPPDWEVATRGYSHMSTKLEHKMVNDFNLFIPSHRKSISVTWQNFLAGYNPYKQNNPDGIRIESLPLTGTLTFNGMPVHAGQFFDLLDFGNFIYNKPENFNGAEFSYNAITNGRWAVPANVKIRPSPIIIPSNMPSGTTESGLAVTGTKGTVVKVFPNPFGKTLNLSVANSTPTSFSIILYDMQGNIKYQKTNQLNEQGTKTIVIDDIPDNVTGQLKLNITLEGNTLRKTVIRNYDLK
jgi:hypothetical protein